MNWITKFIKPKIKSLLKKRSAGGDKTALWTTCECKNLIYKDELFNNLSVCPNCGSHHKLTCEERFKIFFDNKEYTILETPLPKDNPLQFPDYEKLIPNSSSTQSFVDRKAFMESIKAASIFARDGSGIIKLIMDKSSKKISIHSNAEEIGDLENDIDADINGDESKVAFNSRYLQDVVGVLNSDIIKPIINPQTNIVSNIMLPPYFLYPFFQTQGQTHQYQPYQILALHRHHLKR